jgi:long-chain acyl-CoA synthetase
LIIHFSGKIRCYVVVIHKWEGVSVVNVSYIIQQHVTENPDKTAIIFGERRISYLTLERLINRFAGGLLSMGLTRGEVLSLFLPSLPELIIGYLGAVRAGITVNVVNAMLREQEVAYILKDCETRAILVDDKRLPIIESIYSQVESLRKVIVLGDLKIGDYTAFDSVLNQGNDRFESVRTRESDLCHLMYTSGTTGFPKGVMATHRNIRHNATKFGGVHFKPEDTVMVATPIFHCWGLVNGTFGMLCRGGTVITVERFYADQTLAEIERLKPTIFQGVPTIFQGVPPMFNLLLRQPDLHTRDFSSVVFCLSAATKMPENLIRQVEERLKWRYAEAWGLTEVSCVGTTAHYTQTRIGSCGRGMDDAEIKVVDDFGNTLPPGQQGELCIKGTCVTNGYLNKAEATKNAFDAEGWFHSGDVAHMDEDGYAYIVDRKKDMINVGGEKVFPSEVEDMMITHPKIKDLVVVGIPDDLKGEAPKAFIHLKEDDTATEEEIKEFCKLKMAPYKVPVAVEFVEEIPRSASGKALRRMLRDKEWKK